MGRASVPGMTEFVLVPGAWLGAWAWAEIAPALRTAGHGALPLTLGGLAERGGESAGQQDHVADIVGAVERLDLRDVVLVGHSYSGIPVGQAAERIGDRLRRVVYVDATVPVDGQSFVDSWPGGRAMVEPALAAHDGRWPPPAAADYAGQGLDAESVERLVVGGHAAPGRHADGTGPAVPPGGRPARHVREVPAGRRGAAPAGGRAARCGPVAAGAVGDRSLADAVGPGGAGPGPAGGRGGELRQPVQSNARTGLSGQ